jgi:hypothetical protein
MRTVIAVSSVLIVGGIVRHVLLKMFRPARLVFDARDLSPLVTPDLSKFKNLQPIYNPVPPVAPVK